MSVALILIYGGQMIDLGRKPEKKEGAVAPNQSDNKIYYPSTYIDKNIGLSEQDVGKTIMAMCKFKVKQVSTRATEKSKSETCELEMQGIEITKGKNKHYPKE